MPCIRPCFLSFPFVFFFSSYHITSVPCVIREDNCGTDIGFYSFFLHSSCFSSTVVDCPENNSRHATSRHATPRYVTPRFAMPRHATSLYVTPRYPTLRHDTPRRASLHQATPCYVTPRHTTPRYVTPRYATPRYVTLSHVTLRHAKIKSYVFSSTKKRTRKKEQIMNDHIKPSLSCYERENGVFTIQSSLLLYRLIS